MHVVEAILQRVWREVGGEKVYLTSLVGNKNTEYNTLYSSRYFSPVEINSNLSVCVLYCGHYICKLYLC